MATSSEKAGATALASDVMAELVASSVGATANDNAADWDEDDDDEFDVESETAEPAPGVRIFRMTDVGNGELFASQHGEDVRFNHATGEWFAWNESYWKPDDGVCIQRRAKRTAKSLFDLRQFPVKQREARGKWAKQSNMNGKIAAMLEQAKTEGGIPVDLADLDAHPLLLNAPNGIIDLETGKLRPHEKSLLMTRVAGVAYSPDARSDVWDAALRLWTKDDAELTAYLQVVAGLALIGEVREKEFWFFYGPPHGGKSRFLQGIQLAMGDYHVAVDSTTWLARSRVDNAARSDLIRLQPARLVSSVEFKKGCKFDTKLLKGMTGGEPIVARTLYAEEIPYEPRFSAWFFGNERARYPEEDDGVHERLRCVPFDFVIPKAQRDVKFGAALRSPAVRAAVLRWCVDGAVRYLAQGMPETPARVAKAGETYRTDMNPCQEFAEERLAFAPEDWTASSELETCLEQWRRSRPGSKATMAKLQAVLRDRGCEAGKRDEKRGWSGVQVVRL